jgi:poly-gamma-glutamate capsule biosynthesis protein CapA/YwtB (metallophosphatase superfamily)
MRKSLLLGLVSFALAASTTLPASARFVLDDFPPLQSGSATIAFVGDIHFERHLTQLLRPGKMAGLKEIWGDADLVMGNLETAISNGGVRQRKIYTFRAPPRSLSAMKAAGIDVVSLANNHSLDFGASGLKDTLDAFTQSSLVAVGIGADRVAALTPYRVDIPDSNRMYGATPISIFAVATSEMLGGLRWAARSNTPGIVVWESHKTALLNAIKAEAAEERVVIVYAHWGREKETCPTATQRRVAAELEAAGARIIVGAHPHVLQGAGVTSQGAFVAYSLGNFIWYHGRSGQTGALTVRLRDRKVVSADFVPARIGGSGAPRAVAEPSKIFGAFAACANLQRP